MLLHDFLRRSAAARPEAPAVVDQAGTTTYAALDRRASQAAELLIDAGVRRGDRVLLALENGADWAAAYFGILKAGGIVVPLAHGPRSDRLPHVLANCTPAAAITDISTAGAAAAALAGSSVRALFVAKPGGRDPAGIVPGVPALDLDAALDAMRGRDPGVRVIDVDLASIIYTSGSTGVPRGVMLTHLNVTANAESIVDYLGLTGADRVMVVLPFYYVYGLSLLTTHAAAGGAVVIDNRFAFPNAVLKGMQEHAVTGFAGVPSTFAFLLHRSAIARMTFPSLRYVTQAGGPMPPARLREWREVGPRVPFYVMYGATEASARLAYLDPAEIDRRVGSIGRAIPNVDLVVLKEDGTAAVPGEVGEIVARGSNIMAGYWNAPEETKAAVGPLGYRTGDLATIDADGFIYLIGRRQDMLKVGSHRVGAKEIEDTLHEHPAVHEAAVVGMAHDLLGEVPVAFVSLRGGPCAPADLVAFCRERLPEHKVPSRIAVRPELPKSGAGKIDKAALRALVPEPVLSPES